MMVDLTKAKEVARIVQEHGFGLSAALLGRLDEFNPFRAQLLIGCEHVAGFKDAESEGFGADQFGELFRGIFLEHHFMVDGNQRDFDILTGRGDGQPKAVLADGHFHLDFETQFVEIKIPGAMDVEDKKAHVREFADHGMTFSKNIEMALEGSCRKLLFFPAHIFDKTVRDVAEGSFGDIEATLLHSLEVGGRNDADMALEQFVEGADAGKAGTGHCLCHRNALLHQFAGFTDTKTGEILVRGNTV